MDKRTKLWRREQMRRIFKARTIYHAAIESGFCPRADGTLIEKPHWFELAKTKWAQVYKTTGTPCSCFLCQHDPYNRFAFKKDTRRIINETLE